MSGPIIFLVVALAFFLFMTWARFGSSTKANKHIGEICYDKASNTATITARNSYVKKLITIQPELQALLKYNPSEITYTSVGIGGVSVGKFDIKDESTSLIPNKTGKYYLNYGPNTLPWPIYKIKLADHLIESAKQNSVTSKYLNGDTLVLRGAIKAPSVAKHTAAKTIGSGGTMKANVMAGNILLQDMAAHGLTKSECQSIRSWLGGN